MEIILKYICFCIFVASINGTENTTVLNEIKHSDDNLKDISYKVIDDKFNYKFNKLHHDLKTLNIKTLELEDENFKFKERLTKTEENLKNHKEGYTIDLNSFQPCGNSDWTPYEDEKCFRILLNKFETHHEAEKTCNQEYLKTDISIPTLVSIKSAAEQEFLTKFVFDQFEVGDNVWTGAKRRTGNDSQFVWNDGSNINFINWAEDSPSEQIESDCVRMKSKWTTQNSNISTFDERLIGKWVNVPCNETRSVVLCQKLQAWLFPHLQKTLLDTRHELTNTKNQLHNVSKDVFERIGEVQKETKEDLKQTKDDLKEIKEGLKKSVEVLKEIRNEKNELFNVVFNNKVSHYQLFTDINGKNKAFIIPLSAMRKVYTFDESVNLCKNFNSTLIEIQSLQKQIILESFLGRLGFESQKFPHFWINGLRDTSGKWKWIESNTQFNYTNWASSYPSTSSDYNNIFVRTASADTFGKWYDYRKASYVMCEHTFGF